MKPNDPAIKYHVQTALQDVTAVHVIAGQNSEFRRKAIDDGNGQNITFKCETIKTGYCPYIKEGHCSII